MSRAAATFCAPGCATLPAPISGLLLIGLWCIGLNEITASLPALNEPLRILDVGCGYEYLRSWRGFIILCNTMDLFPSRAPL